MASTRALFPRHRPLPYLHRTAAAAASTSAKNQKYERNPDKYWDAFYRRHNNKFFKDRHYLEKDWGRFFSASLPIEEEQASVDPKIVLEVGCGAGNTVFPLLVAFPSIFVHACDFSPHAIKLIQEHEAFECDRVHAFVCDVTKDDITANVPPKSVDVVTMIFMLSAVSPLKMPLVIQNIKHTLKLGGHVLFRDYAVGDFAQEKLAGKDQMISKDFYVRGDGTCAFYFSVDTLSSLFEKEGFTSETSIYSKQIVNRSRGVFMDRRWIRGTFCNSEHDDPAQPLKICRYSSC